jgi:hypothetical protein
MNWVPGILLLAWAVVFQTASAQQMRLAGRVLDNTLVVGIENATVQLLPSAEVRTTNASGEFVFANLSPGSYRLVVTQLGYSPQSIVLQLGQRDTTVTVRLQVRSFYLDEVTVVAQEQRP